MGTPKVEPTVYNVMSELASASSALNMIPDPIKEPHEDAMCLCELDRWAEHSLTHIQAATRSLQPLLNSYDKLPSLSYILRTIKTDDQDKVKAALKIVDEFKAYMR